MKKKKKGNWRARNQITQEVQADLRKKRIFINSKRPLKAVMPHCTDTCGGRLNNGFELNRVKEVLQ